VVELLRASHPSSARTLLRNRPVLGGGGGGGLTEYFIADFEHATYRLNGTASTPDALFYEDAANWGFFNVGQISAGVGLVGSGPYPDNTSPVLNSAIAAARIATGLTLVFDVTLAADASSPLACDVTDIPNFAQEVQFVGNSGDNGFIRNRGNPDEPIFSDIGSSRAKVAFVYRPDGTAAISIEGGDAVAATGPAMTAPNAIAFYATGTIHSITGYSVVSDADLPALSVVPPSPLFLGTDRLTLGSDYLVLDPPPANALILNNQALALNGQILTLGA
jgi:hypothetical protein